MNKTKKIKIVVILGALSILGANILVNLSSTTDEIPHRITKDVPQPVPGRMLFNTFESNRSVSDVVCSRILLDEGIVQNNTWKPDKNCTILNYSKSEMSHFLSSRQRTGTADMWFMGDSRVRRLADMFVSLLMNNQPTQELKKYGSRKHTVDKTVITYIWSPILRGESSWPEQDNYGKLKLYDKLATILTLPEDKRPSFVFLATAVWYIMAQGKNRFQVLTDTLQTLYRIIRDISCNTDTKIVWIIQDRLYPGKFTGRFSKKDMEGNVMITEQNQLAERLLNGSGIHFWRSAHIVAELKGGSTEGTHVNIKAVESKARLLLNIYVQSIGETWSSENLGTSCRTIRTSTNTSTSTATSNNTINTIMTARNSTDKSKL